MDIICTDFDAHFTALYEDAYRLGFLLTRSRKAANDVLLHAFLSLAAFSPANEEQARDLLIRAVMEECEDFYLRKLRRSPKREQLSQHVPFEITDKLWALLKEPYTAKAGAYLTEKMGYTLEQAASLLKLAKPRLSRMLKAAALDISPAAAIRLKPEDAQSILDNVYGRFEERNVPFENKLRRVRRRIDNAMPLVALLIILLFIAAALYTANLH